MKVIDLRTVNVVRYVTPLREGGSLPALVEADDDFLYVMKFRGAGQGPKALIAELIGGELARACGLLVPELVFMNLDESFARSEPDEEIQDLLRNSIGLNLGLHYLSGSIMYDPLASPVDALTASKVVMMDSLITNIDRTYKNPNLLSWHKELWLIDQGASLYFHYNMDDWRAHAGKPFGQVKDHVLLARASQLEEATSQLKGLLTPEKIADITGTIPDIWLDDGSGGPTPDERRAIYSEYLNIRLSIIDSLLNQAQDARKGGL
ncbi:MAG: aminotransferase class I and II [Saprospiraceae bacterium]|nr:aminotransferase class I and II [Saprospiraceae bacterium]MCB9321114.1 aminotransferase class I and II [Lewinellaceae bacterium]